MKSTTLRAVMICHYSVMDKKSRIKMIRLFWSGLRSEQTKTVNNCFLSSRMRRNKEQSERGLPREDMRLCFKSQAKRKQLSIVFGEAMSRVARKTSRVYRGDDFRHKSGRERTRRTQRGLGGCRAPDRSKKEKRTLYRVSFLERITGLEPATSTLARWRSTK